MRRLRFFVLLAGLVWSIGIATAEPIRIEVAKAEAGFDQRTKEPVVTVTLTEASKRLMAEITEKNIGRGFELRVDGRVVMKPVIREPILRGIFQVSGSFGISETKDIAKRLSSGTKIEVELVSD